MPTLTFKVPPVEAITDTVYRVRIVPDAAFSFRAGQYLMVVMDERDKRPFSMASTPDEKGFIELHIGASEINLYAKAPLPSRPAPSSLPPPTPPPSSPPLLLSSPHYTPP
ncbi:FAD-binding oxidoreductase, partial [Ligilactobacillus salivarius]|nr:FAD-binding oxidoreductase [Ligilactobacillus salivarius]